MVPWSGGAFVNDANIRDVTCVHDLNNYQPIAEGGGYKLAIYESVSHVLSAVVALEFELELDRGGRELLLLFLADDEGGSGDHIFSLFVGEGVVEEEVEAGDEEADEGEDHEDDVRDEVVVGDGGGGRPLAFLGGECEGEDEDGQDQQSYEVVHLRFARIPACEAPDDGKDDCDYDDQGADSDP